MNNKISIIGIGKLGICLALNLERNGFDVIGLDVNKSYIDSINDKRLKSDEPNVEKYLKSSNNFKATLSFEEAMENDIIFITVATPSLSSGKYNHSQIDNIVQKICTMGYQKNKKYLIINCTTMPTYCDKINQKISYLNYEVCYNPEFIAQGTILKDQENPDIVLIGSYSETASNIIDSIYKKICKNNPIIHKMSPTEAEITKIALNCFLTTKISYANMVGDIAYRVNCDPNKILSAIGSDSRVGNKYLKFGFGFGGPCFPRDNRAFGLFCEENGIYPHISYSTDLSNRSHLLNQLNYADKNLDKKTPIIFESITYKPESDILEESQQLKYAYELSEKGFNVTIIEREKIINKLKEQYGNRFTYSIR